ncbi:hypothetical protein [Actinokineospora enzanensis]|uniref:hypothetical protein n=1 Tax=Actinokineospora enzanensis TaxID=155975 RepID=UPI00039EE34C|nr:hypothetical protein [Actinokineospora enzanensis]
MTGLYTEDIDVIAWLAWREIDVRTAPVDREPCTWCQVDGNVTTVRVYGRPGPLAELPVEVEDVCGVCAPHVIRQALSERADDRDLVVEVAARCPQCSWPGSGHSPTCPRR